MGGGKSQTSTQQVTIPPEVMARYNAVNARAETAAATPFQAYGGEFVAPLTAPQQTGIQQTGQASQLAQPFYGAGAGLTLNAAQGVGPLTQGQIGYYQNPYTQAVVDPTVRAMQQQQGQQLSQQQTEAIKGGAFGGDRAGIQRAQLMGQQGLAQAQAIAPLYQQGYGQAVQTAQGQQGVIASDLARQMQAGQQLAGLGTGAQAAALQGAQANIGAGTLQQQTQQAQDTAQYQQFLQERGYPFQVAQFLANIAEGTGALSGSTTTGNQPSSMFSDKRLKHDAHKIGETNDGQPIYSFKYNGDNHTQLGLMAQDVEKSHPEAVGESHGYKTVDYEKATKGSRKAYGGGLDPNSMGGAVMEPGAFNRGGYALDGAVVNATDMKALLAQQAKSFGPFAQQGLYGGSSQGMPMGGTGVVPQQAMHVPSPIKPGALPKPADSGASQVYSGYQQLNKIADDMTGKGLTRRLGEKVWGTPEANVEAAGGDMKGASANATTGSQNPAGGVAPMPLARDATATSAEPGMLDKIKDVFSGAPGESHGGGIMPRHHYAGGGDIVPGKTEGDDQLGGVLDAQEGEKHEMLKPADMGKPGGGGGSGIGKGLGSIAGGIAGSFFGPLGTMVGSGLGGMLGGAMHDGGVVPREHFAEGGYKVEPVNLEDLPDYHQSLLNEIAGGESGGKYDIRYGGPKSSGKTFDTEGFHPNIRELRDDGRTSSAAGRYQFTSPTWSEVTGGAPMSPGYQNAAALQLARQEYSKKTGRELDADLQERGVTPEIKSALSGRWESFAKQGLGGARAYAGSQPGAGDASASQAITNAMAGRPTAETGKTKEPGFFDGIGMNKQTIVPLLEGLAGMAGSKSRYLGSAILEGLGAGAKAYGDVEAQQANIGQTQAGTQGVQATTQGTLTDNLRKSLQYVQGVGAVIWAVDPKTGQAVQMRKADYDRRLAAGESIQLINAPNVTGGMVQPPYTKTGEPTTAAKEIAQISEKPAKEGAPLIGTDIDKMPIGLNYSDKSKQHAAADIAGSTGDYEGDMRHASEKMNRIDLGAQAARNQSYLTKQIGTTLVAVNQDGSLLGSPGYAFDTRAGTAKFLNFLARRFNSGESFSGAEKAQDLVQKINTLQSAAQAQSGNQHSFSALSKFAEARPNLTQAPEAAAEILSQIHIDEQRERDREAFALKYRADGTGGGMRRFDTAFEEANPQQDYIRHQEQLQKMILAGLSPENKGKKSAYTLLASGKVPIEKAAKGLEQLGYDPGLVKYFYSRQ
jgi:muramidase (phage lysozyme)